MPRPPRGPGDGEEDNELPMGDPPDDEETDDPSDEDEGEEDDKPLHGGSTVRVDPARFEPRGLKSNRRMAVARSDKRLCTVRVQPAAAGLNRIVRPLPAVARTSSMPSNR